MLALNTKQQAAITKKTPFNRSNSLYSLNKKLFTLTVALFSSRTANVTIIFGRVNGPEQNILIFACHGYYEYVVLFSAMLCHYGCSIKKLCITATALFSSITANVTIIFGRVNGPEQNVLIFACHGYCEYVVLFSAMLCHYGCSIKKLCITATALFSSITANVTIIFGRVSGPKQNILIFACLGYYKCVAFFLQCYVTMGVQTRNFASHLCVAASPPM